MKQEYFDYLNWRRLSWYLLVLLVMQCCIAYGALLLFNALPYEITGIPDDRDVQRAVQRGTISLIRDQFADRGNESEQQVIDRLQPHFGYALNLIPADTMLSRDVQKQLQHDSVAYDEDSDMLYAPLGDEHILQMGPIIAADILEANTMTTIVHLLLWSLLSAVIFFALLYFALAPLWRDALMVCDTAEKLASGDLQARAPRAQSWLFKPLANVLNDMAIKIEHLVQNSRTISQTMAHELRTPLARMRFALDILEETTTPKERERYLAGINGDIQELESLINVSLDFFRLQQHQTILKRNEIRLREWCESLCSTIDSFKPAHFELLCDVEDESACFDGRLGSIVVKNLLLNAFKYAASRAKITIRKQGQSIRIEVDDDGPGISPEIRDKVFIPFFRLNDTRTRASNGYGLGLAYVRLVAELHSGRAFVVSSPLGGARFIVLFDGDE